MHNLLVMFFAVAMFMFFGQANATITLPPVNTNIVNTDKFQFVGSLIVGNVSGQANFMVKADADNLVVGFQDEAACDGFKTGFSATIAKRTLGSDIPVSSFDQAWAKLGVVILIGDCYPKALPQ